MDIESMETFLSVVRNRSISKAAAELYATQPTISLRIKRLEAELGFEVLTRSWRGVELTPQGRHILPVIADHIIRLTSAVDMAQNDAVHLGAPSIVNAHASPVTIAVDEWLVGRGISALISKISILDGVHLTVTSAARLHAMVAHGICDRGISYATSAAPSSDTSSIELWTEPMAIVFPKADPPPAALDGTNLRRYFAERRFILMDDPIYSDHSVITGPLLEAVLPSETRVVDHTSIMASFCTIPGFATIAPAGLCSRKQEFAQPELQHEVLKPTLGVLPVVVLKPKVRRSEIELLIDSAISEWSKTMSL